MLKVFQDMLITAGEEVNAMENHDPFESPVSNDTINEDKTLGRSFLVENDVTALFRATTNLNFSLIHEVHMYLTTPPTNMDCCKYLSDFPTIRKLYLKYNSIRTSEAICERLFRYAGIIFHDTRRSMTDDLFENLLLLHMSSWDWDL
ncbi:uncharacterized protein LOC129572471 [Sitodiplosis mosellana]|uniref:uncharacterized protein LOC129572471 n=1 Tax=Sitodiplosis mosellana TaxID=263140 RepID=UPI002444ED6E|nr:uncharacterized protein LOC129572471 [Sitodiplosis mosellana]